MAFLDEKGNWTGPGADPRTAGSTTTTPQTFNPNTMPKIAPAAGYTPNDWTNLIQGNSNYMSWKLSAAERADVANSNRKAALRTLATRFGGLPAGFKDVYGDLDPGTLSVAAANPLSESARQAKAYADNQEQMKRQLAARGALQSGDLGYGLGQLDYQHSADVYDLGQQFLDSAQGAVNEYGATLSGLSQEQIDQIRQAASDIYDQGYRLGVPGVGGAAEPDVYMGIKGGRPAGNGEVKYVSGPGELDTSGGWGVQWQGPGHYTAVKSAPDASGHSDTNWIFVPDQAAAAATPPADQPIVQAPPVAPSVRPATIADPETIKTSRGNPAYF